LDEYRLVVDVFHFHHRRMQGACLRGWFPTANGSNRLGSLLAVGSDPIVRLPARRQVFRVTERRGRGRWGQVLGIVGCSGELLAVLAQAAQGTGRLTTERSHAANRPAIALVMERGREGRLTLYVSPRTYRPLVAVVDAEGQVATSRLHLRRATPGLRQRWHFPREPNRKPRP
jgi:hypothetical protein